MSTEATLQLEGKEFKVPVIVGSEGEKALDVRNLRAQTGAITYDDGFGNTGSCLSEITFIDGDAGVLRYQYVGNTLEKTDAGNAYANANTTEVYLGLTYGVATFKYSRSTTNLFGYLNSKGSEYYDLSATFDLGNGFSVTPHVGHQYVAKTSIASYTDYSVTLAKDLGNGVSLTAAVVGTDADKGNYANPVNGKFMGKSGVVLGAKYSF